MIQHICQLMQGIVSTIADEQEFMALHKDLLAGAPSMHRNIILSSWEASVCSMSIMIVIAQQKFLYKVCTKMEIGIYPEWEKWTASTGRGCGYYQALCPNRFYIFIKLSLGSGKTHAMRRYVLGLIYRHWQQRKWGPCSIDCICGLYLIWYSQGTWIDIEVTDTGD